MTRAEFEFNLLPVGYISRLDCREQTRETRREAVFKMVDADILQQTKCGWWAGNIKEISRADLSGPQLSPAIQLSVSC